MKLIQVRVDFSALRGIKWYEYAIRFLFGGVVTVAAGLIAKRWGPELGGLFLAFPAIFPASATLVEKKEKEKKAKAGLDGATRGRMAAGLDAAGAALGSVGLMAFAIVVWKLISHHPSGSVMLCGTLAWALVSGLLWLLRKTKLGARIFSTHPHKSRKLFSS